jgi:hypothetical protein
MSEDGASVEDIERKTNREREKDRQREIEG